MEGPEQDRLVADSRSSKAATLYHCEQPVAMQTAALARFKPLVTQGHSKDLSQPHECGCRDSWRPQQGTPWLRNCCQLVCGKEIEWLGRCPPTMWQCANTQKETTQEASHRETHQERQEHSARVNPNRKLFATATSSC